jgi:hypothetical protein
VTAQDPGAAFVGDHRHQPHVVVQPHGNPGVDRDRAHRHLVGPQGVGQLPE